MGSKNGYRSKCWLCKNATDKHSCIWVRTLKKKPKGCITDDDGFIVQCPKYEELDIKQDKTTQKEVNK